MSRKVIRRAREIMECNRAEVDKALAYEREFNGSTPITSAYYVPVARYIEITWGQAVLMAILDAQSEAKIKSLVSE